MSSNKSTEMMSNAKVTASEARRKHNHYVPEQVIFNSILLSASMFGSIFLFCTSSTAMNQRWIKYKNVEVTACEVLIGTIMLLSGAVMFLTSVKVFKNNFGK